MTTKIVYYGPGLCGKTTNLNTIYARTSQKARGEMVSLNTETDRTLFFDLLPMDVGVVGGFKAKLQLYTVPGQVFYNSTRKLVLKGVDGIVFVADSQVAMLEANRESLQNLSDNLKELGMQLGDIPLVFQWNKRDLKNIVPVETLEAELNPKGHPSFQTIAQDGTGVFETLRGITKLALTQIKTLHLGEASAAKGAPGREPAVAPAPTPKPKPAPAPLPDPVPAAVASAPLQLQATDVVMPDTFGGETPELPPESLQAMDVVMPDTFGGETPELPAEPLAGAEPESLRDSDVFMADAFDGEPVAAVAQGRPESLRAGDLAMLEGYGTPAPLPEALSFLDLPSNEDMFRAAPAPAAAWAPDPRSSDGAVQVMAPLVVKLRPPVARSAAAVVNQPKLTLKPLAPSAPLRPQAAAPKAHVNMPSLSPSAVAAAPGVLRVVLPPGVVEGDLEVVVLVRQNGVTLAENTLRRPAPGRGATSHLSLEIKGS